MKNLSKMEYLQALIMEYKKKVDKFINNEIQKSNSLYALDLSSDDLFGNFEDNLENISKQYIQRIEATLKGLSIEDEKI